MAATIVSCHSQDGRSSGGLVTCGGVIVLPMKTGTEELMSTFKHITLFNNRMTRDITPPHPHTPKRKVEKPFLRVRSLGGEGGFKKKCIYVCLYI